MANHFIDLTGKKFGRWTVKKYAGRERKGRYMWDCVCECGNEKRIEGSNLRRGHSKSCGCLPRGRKIDNLVGKRFGTLVVIEEHFGKRKEYEKYQSHWLCQCDCGKTIALAQKRLVNGINKTCGKRECKQKLRELVFRKGLKCIQ